MISVQFPLGFGRLRRPKSYFPPQILRIALNGPQILRSVGDPPTLGGVLKAKGHLYHRVLTIWVPYGHGSKLGFSFTRHLYNIINKIAARRAAFVFPPKNEGSDA